MGINDTVQQKHWIEETNKLWENAQNGNFEFKTIDDVLEENAACKEENENLLQQNEDLNKELTDIYSSEIIGLVILTADVRDAGCDHCDIYATIYGPDGYCSTSSKLSTHADNWRRGMADVFSGTALYDTLYTLTMDVTSVFERMYDVV